MDPTGRCAAEAVAKLTKRALDILDENRPSLESEAWFVVLRETLEDANDIIEGELASV